MNFINVNGGVKQGHILPSYLPLKCVKMSRCTSRPPVTSCTFVDIENNFNGTKNQNRKCVGVK